MIATTTTTTTTITEVQSNLQQPGTATVEKEQLTNQPAFIYSSYEAPTGFYERNSMKKGGGLVSWNGLSSEIKSKNFFRGGFRSYNDHVFVFGKAKFIVEDVLSSGARIKIDWFIERLSEFKHHIPNGVVVVCLLHALSPELNFVVSKSFFLTNKIDVEIIAENLVNELNRKVEEYNADVSLHDLNMVLGYRKWLSTDELKDFKKWEGINERATEWEKEKIIEGLNINEVNKGILETRKNEKSNEKAIIEFGKSNTLVNLVNSRFNKLNWFDDYPHLQRDFVVSEQISPEKIVKVIDIPGLKWRIVKVYGVQNKIFYIFLPIGEFKTVLDLFVENSAKFPYLAFQDEDLGNGNFVRSLANLDKASFFFLDPIAENSEYRTVTYKEIPKEFPNIPVVGRKVKHNTRIAAIDFETFVKSNGEFEVFACGIAWNDKVEGGQH